VDRRGCADRTDAAKEKTDVGESSSTRQLRELRFRVLAGRRVRYLSSERFRRRRRRRKNRSPVSPQLRSVRTHTLPQWRSPLV
jgi:hypothetical protein